MSLKPKHIHLFFRTINSSSSPEDRKKCIISLMHSLRIESEQNRNKKDTEWNSALSDQNLIWLNGRTQLLHEMTTEDKNELLEDIAPKPKLHKQKTLQEHRRKKKHALKSSIRSLCASGYMEAVNVLDTVLAQDSGAIDISCIERFETLEMSRKQQRVRQLREYVALHNKLYDVAPENSIYVQEGVFKIPSKWQVGTDVISLQEYIDFIVKVLSHLFPKHDIKAVVAHDDERTERENTGAHIHFFLSGRNRVTGEYDLRKSMIAVVNKYLSVSKEHSGEELFCEDGKLDYKETRKLGHNLQQLIQRLANERLLSEKKLKAIFTSDTEKKSERYRNMVRQSRWAKSARDFNYFTKQIEDSEKKVALFKEQQQLAYQKALESNNEVTKLQDERQSLTDEIQAMKDTRTIIEDATKHGMSALDNIREEFEEMQTTVNKLSKAEEEKTRDLSRLDKLIEQRKQELLEITQNIKFELIKVVRGVFTYFVSKSNNRANLSVLNELKDKIEKKLVDKFPAAANPLLSSLRELFADEKNHERVRDSSEYEL
ncbi:hypothetical protein AB1740_004210 [Vibrio fluvialis]